MGRRKKMGAERSSEKMLYERCEWGEILTAMEN